MSNKSKYFCGSVCLDAADNVLIERAAGKRIDPKTKGIYIYFIFIYLITNAS